MSSKQHNDKDTVSDTQTQARVQQRPASTVLFNSGAPQPSHQLNKRPAVSTKNQDIATISLTVESLGANIPTLKPEKASPNDNIKTSALKSSQLHYLEVNDSVATQALANAKTAAKILEEAKAIQIAINENLNHTSEQKALSTKNVAIIEEGLEKSQKIVRESNFIHNEIQKIHSKIKKQANDINLEAKNKEVDALIEELKKSRQELDALNQKVLSSNNITTEALNKIDSELENCTKLRSRLESKEKTLDHDIQLSQETLKKLTEYAMQYLDQSEENLTSSKQGQTSYIAVSREINALRDALNNQTKRTSNLNHDIQTANKAIALNKTAVEALTNDMLNVKQSLRVSKKSTLITQSKGEMPAIDSAEIQRLFDQTYSAQKRMSQLLQLNNTVSDRITRLDTALSEKSNTQDTLAIKQTDALKDIQIQKEAVKKLVEQASRSHTLIVSACKKTAALAQQIDTLTAEDQQHRQVIMKTLGATKAQKNELNALSEKLACVHTQHSEFLKDLALSRDSISKTEQSLLQKIEIIDKALIEISNANPIVANQKEEVCQLVIQVRTALTECETKNRELQQLQNALEASLDHHQQAQKDIRTQLESHASTMTEVEAQQNSLKNLEINFTAHIDQFKTISGEIQQKMKGLIDQQGITETIAKDLDFSKTEIRYLKEQCDQLLKEYIEQSEKTKKQTVISQKSLDNLGNMEKTISQSLATQKQQEDSLDQLNTLVNTALNDLNLKLDQFHSTQKKIETQQTKTQETQTRLNQSEAEQTIIKKQVNTALEDLQKNLDMSKVNNSKISLIEERINGQVQQQSATIESQLDQMNEQANIIAAQLNLLEDVKLTHEKTQASLDTIEKIRRKAQQSFVHLGEQKTKFEMTFKDATQKIELQNAKQEQQEALLLKTKEFVHTLQLKAKSANDFEQWQQEITAKFNEKMAKIDEYQSRAFQVQQSNVAREQQLEERYKDLEGQINHFQILMEKLDTTRLEEAQYRDELRSLVHLNERQQKNVAHQLHESEEKHVSLSKSLEDAYLMFRENKLATQETQMANRETKLILQEIRREIAQLREKGLQMPNTREWAAEERIDALTHQLDHEQKHNMTEPKAKAERDSKPFKPSSFML